MAKQKSIAKIADERAKKEVGVHHFLYLYDAIFENAINAVGNPGQAAILAEIEVDSRDPMVKLIVGTSRQPGKGFFRALFVTVAGSEKYNAVSQILEEVIYQLVEAWDDSNLYDERDKIKMFLSTNPEDYMTNAPNPQAQMWKARANYISGRL